MLASPLSDQWCHCFVDSLSPKHKDIYGLTLSQVNPRPQRGIFNFNITDKMINLLKWSKPAYVKCFSLTSQNIKISGTITWTMAEFSRIQIMSWTHILHCSKIHCSNWCIVSLSQLTLLTFTHTSDNFRLSYNKQLYTPQSEVRQNKIVLLWLRDCQKWLHHKTYNTHQDTRFALVGCCSD